MAIYSIQLKEQAADQPYPGFITSSTSNVTDIPDNKN